MNTCIKNGNFLNSSTCSVRPSQFTKKVLNEHINILFL